jgi:hypothetical protein
VTPSAGRGPLRKLSHIRPTARRCCASSGSACRLTTSRTRAWATSSVTGGSSRPGLRPELFFVPDQLRDRARRQGFAALDHRFAAALADFATRSGPWLDLVSVTGAEPVQAAYRELLDGTLPAASALICRMSPGQAGV